MTKRIKLTTESSIELRLQNKRVKTERASTETIGNISSSKVVHKRYSSLKPIKTES